MNRPAQKTVRRRFFTALGQAIHLAWPVLSTILAIQIALGLLIGCRGLVSRRRGLFHFRHRPHHWLWRYRAATGARAGLAIGIGISGLFLTGLTAGIAVYAMRTALVDRRTD
jgi:hypothetical protein